MQAQSCNNHDSFVAGHISVPFMQYIIACVAVCMGILVSYARAGI